MTKQAKEINKQREITKVRLVLAWNLIQTRTLIDDDNVESGYVQGYDQSKRTVRKVLRNTACGWIQSTKRILPQISHSRRDESEREAGELQN